MQYPIVVPTRPQRRMTKARPAGRMSEASVHAMEYALFAAVICINSCGKLSDPRVSTAACQATVSNGGQCKWRGIYQTALPELMIVSYPGIVNWI